MRVTTEFCMVTPDLEEIRGRIGPKDPQGLSPLDNCTAKTKVGTGMVNTAKFSA